VGECIGSKDESPPQAKINLSTVGSLSATQLSNRETRRKTTFAFLYAPTYNATQVGFPQDYPMGRLLILASSSTVRHEMLTRAGVDVQVSVARIDEQAIKESLVAESISARDIADALADAKVRRVSQKYPSDLVLGCDQTLVIDGKMLSKPDSPEQAAEQLHLLSGKTHELFSAAVLYDAGKPIWRVVSRAKMHMRPLSGPFIQDYVTRNWPKIGYSVGSYLIEDEGVRLFHKIEGDHFTILGLPLIDVLNYLVIRGFVES
jgi:septum formation protein